MFISREKSSFMKNHPTLKFMLPTAATTTTTCVPYYIFPHREKLPLLMLLLYSRCWRTICTAMFLAIAIILLCKKTKGNFFGTYCRCTLMKKLYMRHIWVTFESHATDSHIQELITDVITVHIIPIMTGSSCSSYFISITYNNYLPSYVSFTWF